MRERETLPVQPPAAEERTEGEEMFATLAAIIEKPPKREWAENSWIRPGTWAAIDERGSKKNAGILKRQEGRKLMRRIKRLLGKGRMELAQRAGEKATSLRARRRRSGRW